MNERNSSGSNLTAWLMLFAILLLLGGGGATFYIYRTQQLEEMRRELQRADLEAEATERAHHEAELQLRDLERSRKAEDSNSTNE